MTFSEIDKILESEITGAGSAIIAQVTKNLDSGFEQDIDQIMDLEAETRNSLDESCLFFSKNRRWPAMPLKYAQIALIRVGVARQFVTFLRTHPNFSLFPAIPEEALLKLLLVDYWNFAGVYQWLLGLKSP